MNQEIQGSISTIKTPLSITILVCNTRNDFYSFRTAIKRTLSSKLHPKKTKNSDQGWGIYSILIDKKQLAKKLTEPVNPHRLYNLLAREIIERVNFSILTEDIYLIVDKSKGGHERAIFDYYLKTHLEPKLPINISLRIFHEISHTNAGLQAVDLFCHGIVRKHSLNDHSWYSIFSEKIIEEIRWFPKFQEKKDGSR